MTNYSRARRRHGINLIRRSGVLTDTRVTDEARLMYAVGVLIATDQGHVSDTALQAAYADPSVLQAAHELLRKAAA